MIVPVLVGPFAARVVQNLVVDPDCWLGSTDHSAGEPARVDMKTAEALIDHILGCVRPPRHHRIELLEQAGEPNWIATIGVIELTYLEQFITKVIELRKSHRLIDWDGVTEQEWGHRDGPGEVNRRP
jgi:hypothetical protein